MIWEWLDAIQCWLSNLFKTEWTTPSIDDIGFPEPPSITFSVNGQAVWSTKEIAEVDFSDKDNNRVLDYVEKNAGALFLTNTLQETIIEKNETVRIDAALETSKNLINDDTSQVALVVTQIDDLDSRKSYKIGDKDWDTLRDSYVLVSGSPTLKDGHVTWTLQAKNNHRARVYIESRIYSGDKIFLRSEKSIILIGPKKIPLTVLSTDDSTTTQTLQAGDTQGIRVILGNTEPVITRATIGIYDYVTGKKYFTFKDVSVQNNRLQISANSLGDFLKKSGRYTFDIESGELA